ncbi:MAG: tetratricopeptide repeat protein, partial [Chloroflexota bacterium]
APMVKVFPLSVITERIEQSLDSIPMGPRNLPSRQRTLIETLKWSSDLLKEDEKLLFVRLAIFRGGGTLDAVDSICGKDIPENISKLLSALVNKNLIMAQERVDGEIHFTLLETIRQYNLKQLETSGELDSIAKLHAEYFSHLAEEAEPHFSGSGQLLWLEKLEIEHDNLRSALAWSLNSEVQADFHLLFTASLEYCWVLLNFLSEGRRWLNASLSRPGAAEQTTSRAKALAAAGHLAYNQSAYSDVRIVLEESLSIYRNLGPAGRRGYANTLITLGDVDTEVGDYDTGSSLMLEALGIMRELKDEKGIARALWQLGACAVRPGEYEKAGDYFNEALIYLRKQGNGNYTAVALSGLAEIAIRQGDYLRAEKLGEESLAIRREIKENWGSAVSLGHSSWIAL